MLATTYIDEYVPIKTPKIKAKLNPFINSPPKINRANKTNKAQKYSEKKKPENQLPEVQDAI